MSQEKILPIAVGAALKSLRNTDFDLQTAICEVIDNSLQANSHEIKIREIFDDSSRKKIPKVIAFGDDGEGMNEEDLQYCLKLGYSGRYDKRDGIGRFGVGMTFAAISLCQKIEVYSRQKQGNWAYTFLDISGIDNDADPYIAPIEQKGLPNEYKDLVGDVGTLVIWSNIDRIDSHKKEDDLMHELGRIYRKFIGSEIVRNEKVIKNPNQSKIYFNNKIVHSHDPLFVTKSSQFPDDETAKIDSEVTFEWSVHEVDAPSQGQKRGKITIRASLLPESWRRIRAQVPRDGRAGRAGSGRSKDNLRRKVDENEGISILRHGREVSYGIIPFLLTKDREIDRYWSCEIDFEPVLDHWFSVRNIKIGARPITDLKEELRSRLKGTVSRFRENIKKTMDAYDAEQNKSENGPLSGNIGKEKELSGITTPPSDNPDEDEQDKIETAAETVFPDDPDLKKEYIEKVSNKENKYNIIEIDNQRADSPFFEIVPDLATKVMHYNMNSPFFLHLYRTVKELADYVENDDKEQILENVKRLKGYFDNLFFAYSEAFYDLDDLDRAQNVKDTMDELMTKWNLHLRKIYRNI